MKILANISLLNIVINILQKEKLFLEEVGGPDNGRLVLLLF